MVQKLSSYRSIIFDCDGVLLDSNQVKTEAFRVAASRYGIEVAQEFVIYHLANGGVSRYKKFDYLIRDILKKEPEQSEIEDLLGVYAEEVQGGLMSCSITPDLHLLKPLTPDARWHVASGGDEGELRDVFVKRGIAALFEGGIFGSPDPKEIILSRELKNGNIGLPALFLGDSEYDHKVATLAGMDFIFVHGWTEFKGWQAYTQNNQIRTVSRVAEIFQ